MSNREPGKCYLFSASLLLLLILAATSAAYAQDGSATDGTTPSALTPGAPAGSYALSDFENINPYNGGMNFHLPLHAVKGRGGAAFNMMLAIEQKWRVERFYGVQFPAYNWWDGITPGYGPGVVQMRQVAATCQGTFGDRAQSNTRLTFTTPDGTEYEMWDTQHHGENQWFACYDETNMPSRGTTFTTINSESATFVSDTTIHDFPSSGILYPSGYMLLRDGTRYRIDGGTVTWMRDRNGNYLTFSYDSNSRVTSITDSLNRQVTVSYDVDDGSPYGVCDRITFKGYGGATRYLRISKTDMSNVLRSGYSIHTYSQLFPEFSMQMPDNLNPTVVSAVWLPDGRSYQFQYDDYAELARVVLPTGGAYEYDYTGGISGGYSSGTFFSGMYGYDARLDVYRRLIERRTYPDGGSGSSYTLKNVYSRPENSSGGNLGYVDMDDKDSSGTLLSRSRHYYNGSPVSSFLNPTDYPDLSEGREYKTEELASNGTTVLRRTEDTWTPRANFTWSSSYYPYDYLITQTVKTLVDTNQVSKETYSYDQYNNRTDVYEYDYGSGSAGSLIRQTHTDFLTTNSVNSTDYTATSIHMRSLPTQISVYDASSNEKARTTFEYDNYTSDSNHASLTPRSGISGLDSGYSSSYTTRGNATRAERVKFGTSNTYVDSYSQFDVAGNLVRVIDPRGNATNIYYDDCFGGPDGNARLIRRQRNFQVCRRRVSAL